MAPEVPDNGSMPTRTMRAPDDVLAHLHRARDLADREYAQPLDLDGLAAAAGLSKYHFLRLFKATYGLTPAEYVSQRRIERAQDLLRATNLTLTRGVPRGGLLQPRFVQQPVPGAGGGEPSRLPEPVCRRRCAAHPGLLRVHVGTGGALRNRGEAPGAATPLAWAT